MPHRESSSAASRTSFSLSERGFCGLGLMILLFFLIMSLVVLWRQASQLELATHDIEEMERQCSKWMPSGLGEAVEKHEVGYKCWEELARTRLQLAKEQAYAMGSASADVDTLYSLAETTMSDGQGDEMVAKYEASNDDLSEKIVALEDKLASSMKKLAVAMEVLKNCWRSHLNDDAKDGRHESEPSVKSSAQAASSQSEEQRTYEDFM
mmetsp:Transcript_12064/g.26661  ORF Transcript_12064/g.26661 Transcript_12064/m.26661 type:complete len:209 (-) Transcript_12064:403-1029(-)